MCVADVSFSPLLRSSFGDTMPLAFGEGNPVFNQAGRARLESEYCHVQDSAISTLLSVDIAEHPKKHGVCVRGGCSFDNYNSHHTSTM